MVDIVIRVQTDGLAEFRLSLEEVAEVARVSVSTVRRDWRVAQAWLHQQLSEPL